MRIAPPVFALQLAWLLVAACSDGRGGAPDGGDAADATTLTCREIADGLRARAQAVSKQCSSISDCSLVGYASSGGIPTCNCGHTFAASCQGDPVNGRAWRDDPLVQALLVEWEARCLTVGCGVEGLCGCDCGLGDVFCSSNGICGVRSTNACFPGSR